MSFDLHEGGSRIGLAKSAKRTAIVDGRARRSYGHGKAVADWDVMIQDHHEGYIAFEAYQRNRHQLALNTFARPGGSKSGRGGRALPRARSLDQVGGLAESIRAGG